MWFGLGRGSRGTLPRGMRIAHRSSLIYTADSGICRLGAMLSGQGPGLMEIPS